MRWDEELIRRKEGWKKLEGGVMNFRVKREG